MTRKIAGEQGQVPEAWPPVEVNAARQGPGTKLLMSMLLPGSGPQFHAAIVEPAAVALVMAFVAAPSEYGFMMIAMPLTIAFMFVITTRISPSPLV